MKISFGLSVSEIKKAQKQIRDYQKSLNRKCEILCSRLNEIGNRVALQSINESPLGKTIVLSSEISSTNTGCKAILTSIGQDKTNEYGTVNTLLLVEFGAGIHFNATANPKANEMGMGVGTFPDQTHAFEDGWYYLNEDNRWVYTHGTKATMPMYNAMKAIREQYVTIAKEVFKS